jgi:hypothetical protein
MTFVIILLSVRNLLLTASAVAPVKLDLGPADAKPAAGYHRVSESTKYDKKLGYGWLAIPDAKPMARKEPADQRGDAIAGHQYAEMRIDIPDGLYRLTLQVGDVDSDEYSLNLDIDGLRVLTRLHTRKREFATVRITTAVQEGRLRITFCSDTENWMVSSITVEPIQEDEPRTISRTVLPKSGQ